LGDCLPKYHLRKNHAPIPTTRMANVIPTPAPALAPALLPPDKVPEEEGDPESSSSPGTLTTGIPPNGQKSPFAGKMHVNESASGTLTKSGCSVLSLTRFASTTAGSGLGVSSVGVQLTPRAPMYDVLPTKVFPRTVKLVAEFIASA